MAAEPPVDTKKIVTEAREAIEATKQYTVQQKEAFHRKAHEELVAIQEQVFALQGKASKALAVIRTELQKSINELGKKWDIAKNKLDELRAATDAKWIDVKTGMTSALDELKNSYLKALSHLP
jgi:DNA integrity scanning protein DisA with diadenylate cyclase activity